MPIYVFFDHTESHINSYKEILQHIPNFNCKFLYASLKEIIDNYYKKVPFVIVSPANSYGNMRGGIDRQIIKHFPRVEHAVIDKIATLNYKDSGNRSIQPLGITSHVPLDKSGNCLIICPTMETPRNIVGTNNIYVAFKSLYLYTKNLPDSVHIFVPCLGTGVGGMTGKESALQILSAINKN